MAANPNDPNRFGAPEGMNPYGGQNVPPYPQGQYDPNFPQGQYDPNFPQGQYDPNYQQGQFAPGYPVPQDPQYYPQGQYDPSQMQYDPNLAQTVYDPNLAQGQFQSPYAPVGQTPYDPNYQQPQYGQNIPQGQYDPNFPQPYDPNYPQGQDPQGYQVPQDPQYYPQGQYDPNYQQPQYDANFQQSQYDQNLAQPQFQSPYEPVGQTPYDSNYQEDPSVLEQLSKTTSVFPGAQEPVSATEDPGESGFRESYYKEYGQESSSEESGEEKPEKKSKKKLLLILIPSIVAFLGAFAAVFFIFIMPKIKGDDENLSAKKKKKSTRDYDATDEYDEDDEDDEDDDDDDDDDTKKTTGAATDPDVTEPGDSQTNAPTQPQYVSQTVTSSSQITSDQMTGMQNFAKTDITNELGSIYNVTITNVNILGSVIMVSKDPADPNTADSVVYLVYQVQLIERVGTVDKSKEYFWYEGFDGVNVNGSLDQTRYKTSTKINGETGWSVSGTDSIDSVRSAIISSSKYTLSEDNINKSRIITLSPAPDTPETRGMFCPKSSSELIPEDVIKKMTTEEIRYAINEIWARHGYIFENNDMLRYYQQFSWYKPKISKSSWNDGKGYLNQIETENINRLAKEREARGGNPQ